jgi:hypothetical protein
MLCDGALPYMLLKAVDKASCPCYVLGGLSMALALANLTIHPKIGRPQMQPALGRLGKRPEGETQPETVYLLDLRYYGPIVSTTGARLR